MKNKEFDKELEVRTRQFGAAIILLSLDLFIKPEHKVIRYQLTKSGTSVGANFWEAKRSRSKSDFRHKIMICESEANETIFWLRLIEELKLVKKEPLQDALHEANELLEIFTSFSNKLNNTNIKCA